MAKSTISRHANTGYAQEGYKGTCGKCGAVRIDKQIGLEATIDEYVQTMVEVFREVKRVLRPDGVLFVNWGDSYSTHAAGVCTEPMATSHLAGVKTQEVSRRRKVEQEAYRNSPLPEKNLIGVPWRCAFALQADGWWLRSDIIWAKNNPMPESVTDRVTKSHEYIFMLTKNAKYFYDADAVREPLTYPDRTYGSADNHKTAELRNHGNRTTGGLHDGRSTYANPAGRNLRSVWNISTFAFPGSHFATFPPALVEPCIKAGTSEKGCCGAKVKKLRLRQDLTGEDRAKVLAVLQKRGLA